VIGAANGLMIALVSLRLLYLIFPRVIGLILLTARPSDERVQHESEACRVPELGYGF
jgi:hypothetical protein